MLAEMTQPTKIDPALAARVGEFGLGLVAFVKALPLFGAGALLLFTSLAQFKFPMEGLFSLILGLIWVLASAIVGRLLGRAVAWLWNRSSSHESQ